MLRQIGVLCLLLCAGSAVGKRTAGDARPGKTAGAHAGPAIELDMQLYRVPAGATAGLPPSPELMQRLDGNTTSPAAANVLKLGEVKGGQRIFSFEAQAAPVVGTGDGAPVARPMDMETPTTEGIMLICRPRVVVVSGQRAQIGVNGRQPVEYFVPAGPNLYRLERTELPMGLSIEVQPQDEGGQIRLRNFSVGTNLVERRKPLAGTELNVGVPILSSRKFTAEPELAPGEQCVMVFSPGDEQGTLLIRVKASLRYSTGTAHGGAAAGLR